MPTNRNTDPYGGRFARDASSSGVLAGYQQAVAKIDKDSIQRNLNVYKKYGLEQSQAKIRKESDQQRYTDAAQAVVKKFEADKKAAKAGNKTVVVKKPKKVVKPIHHTVVRKPPPKAPKKPPVKRPPKKPIVKKTKVVVPVRANGTGLPPPR